jgi:tetratricopeptide (TPR) repeat protein
MARAEEVLARCLDEHPAFLGSVLPLASTMLARGAEPAGVAEHVERRVREVTPSVRFMLGTALYEANATVEAERQFRGLLERQPASGPARVALAEALLSQGRYAEAAQEAVAVDPESPARPAALRTGATSSLLAGDLDGVSRLLDGDGDGDGGGLPADDRALFSAWLALARGEDGPTWLPPGCAGLLAVVLEALLRLVEVDAFALLVGLLDRVGMPWRERREVLAAMYLRRGFLESAGDEWIDVCSEAGVDVPALIGLAQVAYARGQLEDARVFAAEACALEPNHEVAERLATRLAAVAGREGASMTQVLMTPVDHSG